MGSNLSGEEHRELMEKEAVKHEQVSTPVRKAIANADGVLNSWSVAECECDASDAKPNSRGPYE